jgi:Acyl-CoA reductase (LuxC)
MNVEERIDILVHLGEYMTGNDESWQAAQRKAFAENHWFIPEFITLSINNIVQQFLQYEVLKKLVKTYNIPQETKHPKKVGLVLAGNIPLVGFHDVLCTFLVGHYAHIKPSAKDTALIKHLVQKMTEWNEEAARYFEIRDLLKGCDAYIATGGNNTGRYFDYYFRNHPHIIRKARTSVAILTGNETPGELEGLADDVYQYFGLGCRNVTQLFVPRDYDFVPLLTAFKKYDWVINHHKYKNNYDYNLALHLLNNKKYMTNGSILVVEDASPFSPISQLHFQYYEDLKKLEERLSNNESIQCVVGNGLPFGAAQRPGLTDFADGVDTMAFLKNLSVNEG